MPDEIWIGITCAAGGNKIQQRRWWTNSGKMETRSIYRRNIALQLPNKSASCERLFRLFCFYDLQVKCLILYTRSSFKVFHLFSHFFIYFCCFKVQRMPLNCGIDGYSRHQTYSLNSKSVMVNVKLTAVKQQRIICLEYHSMTRPCCHLVRTNFPLNVPFWNDHHRKAGKRRATLALLTLLRQSTFHAKRVRAWTVCNSQKRTRHCQAQKHLACFALLCRTS